MEVPSAGIALADIAEGSLVKINENGSPVEFYVAKHDYESGLNGTGRTLLVRKDCYAKLAWDEVSSSGTCVNTYSNSTINAWFNSTYKAMLDSDVQTAIGTTKFYYTPGNTNFTVTTLSRAIFALSYTELGMSYSTANVEGSALPIANTLKIAYLDGSACEQWTRTPRVNNTEAVWYMGTDAGCTSAYILKGYRPALTIPATTLFDEETMEFKEVA